MGRSHITVSSPLEACQDLLRLVFTFDFPLKTFLATPVHLIQLRTLAGRRRSYRCRVASLPSRLPLLRVCESCHGTGKIEATALKGKKSSAGVRSGRVNKHNRH